MSDENAARATPKRRIAKTPDELEERQMDLLGSSGASGQASAGRRSAKPEDPESAQAGAVESLRAEVKTLVAGCEKGLNELEARLRKNHEALSDLLKERLAEVLKELAFVRAAAEHSGRVAKVTPSPAWVVRNRRAIAAASVTLVLLGLILFLGPSCLR